MEIMYDVSFAATMFLGSAIMILTAFYLYGKALDKILGLLKVKEVRRDTNIIALIYQL